MNNTRVLVLFAHPQLHKSRANTMMVDAVQNINGITFHDLYASYPDFYIDVKAEQQLLLEHELIVFQHPFYWYSSPAILKEWQDVVLQEKWAYGEGGNKLAGKHFMLSLTAGGGEEAYKTGGYNYFTVNEFLRPFEQTAKLCQMHWHPPCILYGSIQATEVMVSNHAQEYLQLLKNFVQEGPSAFIRK